jgi:peptide deformylase
MDHLEGILFIDYLSKLKKSMIIKKLSKKKKIYSNSCLINV